MKNKVLSITLTTAMTLSAMPFTVSAETTESNELWDKFLKYDLCITDFNSLTDEEKELCHFIFDTEEDFYNNKNEVVVCERARRILKGNDVGKRITAEQLEDSYGIHDVDSGNYHYYYTNCVPDIKHLDSTSEHEPYSEYWLDDDGNKKVLFNDSVKYTDLSFTLVSGETEKEIAVKDSPYFCLSEYSIEECIVPEGTIEVNDDFYYITDNGTAVLLKNKNADVTFNTVHEITEEPHIIPDEVNGYPVTAIESRAFCNTPYKEIVMPETIESIGNSAFAGSNYLETINFPTKLKMISSSAFSNTNITEISIDCPELFINTFAFSSTKLKSAVINAKELSGYAFYNNWNLAEVTLGESIEKIGNYAFEECIIEELKISSGVKVIVQNALSEKKLSNVEIPSSVSIIGAYMPKRGAYEEYEESSYVPLHEDDERVFNENCTIYGYTGTETEKYAKSFDIPFIALDEKAESIKGDANCDGNVNMADAVLIMQSLANPDKYGVNGKDETHITAHGEKNGDMDGNGLTNADALEIQKMLLKIS